MLNYMEKDGWKMWQIGNRPNSEILGLRRESVAQLVQWPHHKLCDHGIGVELPVAKDMYLFPQLPDGLLEPPGFLSNVYRVIPSLVWSDRNDSHNEAGYEKPLI